MLVQNQQELGKGSAILTDPHHTPTITQPSTSQPKETQKPRKPKRKDTQVPQPSGPTDIVADEAVHKELGDSLVRAATTASSLEAKQDNGNITKTRSKATPNEYCSLGTTSGGGPRCQETIGDTIAQTRFENVSKLCNDSLLARGNTLRSDEDSLKLNELMELCTNLQQRVLDLEKTKTTQAEEIVSLKRRVKKLEQKKRSRSHGLKRLHKVGMSKRVESSGDEEDLEQEVAAKRCEFLTFEMTILVLKHSFSFEKLKLNELMGLYEDITLVSVQDDANKEMFSVDTLNGESTTTTISSQGLSQDKGKGILVEPDKPLKKKDQLKLDEEIALKLQAEIDEEERIARAEEEKINEANIAWNDIQAKVDADYQLAERLQAKEQEQFTIEEKATLFKELLEQRRKHFAAKIAEEKRNKPPTKTQQKKIMITYLKNMEGWKHKDLKSKDFDSIKELFDKAFTRVNMFVDFRIELVEGSSKRAGEELEQESTKKQKVDEDKDTTELQSLIEVILDEEEVAIDAVPLATKSPSIVDWKIHKEGNKSYYQIVRADGKSQMYRVFSQMLKSFTREDLEDMYKSVKARYGSTRLVEDLDLVLWNDLKTMFEPHVEDEIWKLQQRYKVLSWKLFDSCGVNCLSLQSGMIYMLVEKRYPLTPPTITNMLNNKLQVVEYKSFTREDLEELFKLVKARYGSTRPVEDLDLVLWNDLKTMFEPHVEDEIWKLQQRYKVLSWMLFDSCGVHCLSLQSGMIYMLVEKRYPLTPPTIIDMINNKLQGRIVGIKSLLNAASITAALIDVNAAQSKLVLLENFNENYSKCLRLLVKLQLPVQSYYC
ncbi:hypothetical protein Tco_1104811 [Tanacetum coccineum]